MIAAAPHLPPPLAGVAVAATGICRQPSSPTERIVLGRVSGQHGVQLRSMDAMAAFLENSVVFKLCKKRVVFVRRMEIGPGFR